MAKFTLSPGAAVLSEPKAERLKLSFACDGMLGKLTRWLRILGYSVDLLVDREDEQILAHCKQFNTTLLTSDVELFKRASNMNLATHLVSVHDNVSNQLAKISKKYNLELTLDIECSRCPICNSQLHSIPRSEALRLAPAASFSLYNHFWRCLNDYCGKVYWKGSHWVKILKVFEEARRIAGSINDE